ncbi:MAG: hypothetical protein L6R37_002743 [Teloschistes peruensis]|nr:MAG: hypothetical protein L6R37_002743 [Teloschistes peruensis]
MVAELSALQQIINALTGLNGLWAVVTECIVTTIYTCVQTNIDKGLVHSTNLLEASLLGWQLMYILPVAILTNDFFISGFWMRTFASKTDKDLIIGTSIAVAAIAIILTLVGASGLLAAWTGAWPGNPPQEGSIAFFLLLKQLPAWVVGIVIVLTVSLSTAAFDSLQSAMVSTGSNDLFRNKLNLWFIRLAVVLVMFPVAVVALKSPSVLQIYLISDLVSASSIPVLVIGLSDKCFWWRGFEVVLGGLGGLLTVFVFGAIYYGNAKDGANLMLLTESLYVDDWSAFGAFVAAPIGGLLWGFGAFSLRIGIQWTLAKTRGHQFGAFDRPSPAAPIFIAGARERSSNDEDWEDGDPVNHTKASSLKGRFW